MGDLEEKVKKYITSLLTSTPLVVTIQQLNKDYTNTIGQPVPYQKLGYNSFEHFLRSIPDVVQVKGGGPGAQLIPVLREKSAHVNQLVTHQKVVVKRNNRYVPQKRTNAIFPAGYHQFSHPFENKFPQMPPRKMYYPTNNNVPPPPKPTPHPISTYNGSRQSDSYNFSKTQSSHVTHSNNPPRKHSNLTGGGTSSNKVEENVSEVKPANCSAPSKYKWVNPKITVNDLDRISTEQVENNVPLQVRNNLRTLISQCPEGIWCAEVPDRYRKMFRRILDYQELGFKSLIHLCVGLSSIFHYVRPSTGDYKLYDRSRPLPKCAETIFTMASYSANNNKNNSEVDPGGALPSLDWADVKKFLPNNIFMPGQEISRAFVPHDVQENDEIDIVVGEIYDLSKFWVYIANSQLDGLMDAMQDFYRENVHEYLIPDHLIKEGIYCVQVIFGEYHRALIVDTMPELENTIRVIFIDYGTMTKVSTKGLCFLHTRFSELEAQAIRCRLANVIPLEEGAPWTREACKAFRRLVVDRDITAKISHINWDEQYLEVFLADVTDKDGCFYINDKLVEEGLAQQPDKERRRPVSDPIYTPIVKYLHLFPTFLELERGLAPSTAEMEVFHECNVPINFLYPQYFRIDQDSEEAIIARAQDFHERHCLREKRRTPSSQYFDRERAKSQQSDLTVFGEIWDEIATFLDKSVKEEPVEVNTEVVDEEVRPERKSCSPDLNSLTERLRELTTKQEETVNVLKQDLIVTEDIMKDICKLEAPTNDRTIDFVALKEEWQRYDTLSRLSSMDGSKESVDGLNCTVIKNDALDVSTEVDLSCHPLSAMTFASDDENGHSGTFSDYNYDLKPPNVHLNAIQISLLPENDPSSIINRLKVESERTVCTNPFLKDLTDTTDHDIDETKLNPNNPFLNFLHEDEGSSTSGSTTSTDYESPVVITHSWSTFTDMSAETVSLLGKSLRPSSSSSDSLKASDDRRSCSTQTSDHRGGATGAAPAVNPAHYAHHPYQPPWPPNYAGNPYYNVRFSNFQGYAFEAQPNLRPPCPPGLPPPPGFFPLTRFPGLGSAPPSYAPTQYGMQPRPACYYSGAPVMPRLAPPFNNPINRNDGVGDVGDYRDFYEAYNEQLRQRFNHSVQ